jgi:hypothetical protein
MGLNLVFILISLAGLSARAALPDSFNQKNTSYRTYSGSCPDKSTGLFAMIVMKEFEKRRSLKDVKEKILAEKLDEKFFLSDYRVSYNPMGRTVRIDLTCPEPLAKVQVYKQSGEEHYSAILGENGKLYEPGYETLMKVEKKLEISLPLLALDVEQLEGETPLAMARLIRQMELELRKKVSEIILNKNNEVTIVFALGRKATSVFLGSDQWGDKLAKLSKIVDYVSKSNRYPSSINLVNLKKVVVKFSDKT